MKSRLSRQIGVPLTRSGRQRKFGKAAGRAVVVVAMSVAATMIIVFALK